MPTKTEMIEKLLEEFQSHRQAIMVMVQDLESLKKNIDNLFPKNLDQRYVKFFEEKIKTITEFFKTILEMRKEIQKSLKDEIELRRKIDIDEKEKDIGKLINIRDLSDKIMSFQHEKEKLKKTLLQKAQSETDEIADTLGVKPELEEKVE